MHIDIVIRVSPEEAHFPELYEPIAAEKANLKLPNISYIEVLSKSIDARSREVKIELRLRLFTDENFTPNRTLFNYRNVALKSEVIIIGAGPAGLFAALRLIELGLKPVIIERGKDVKERRRDIALISRESRVNSESNYCFGEGGAGTFSDGKLYTRSKKRGNIKRILEILEYHGADKNILVDAHPHIGTNKLPGIIVKIRETIQQAGGVFLFNSKVTDFIIKDSTIKGVVVNNNEKYLAKSVILATGHSASDIYYLLNSKGIAMEAKPFAVGVRVEHPQSLIDSIQYHCNVRDKYLPAASYKLVTQVNNRGVYSFCMCPGGFIVPSATSPNEIVVNGMSPSSRNSKFANSGMVVEVGIDDLSEFKKFDVLAGLAFRENIEKTAFMNGGNGQVAPAQRLTDFVNSKLSNGLPDTSYRPGVVSSPLHFWLPESIGKRLQEGFLQYEKKMRGFITNDALVVGVETRTSSPVRVSRNNITFEHIQIKGRMSESK